MLTCQDIKEVFYPLELGLAPVRNFVETYWSDDCFLPAC